MAQDGPKLGQDGPKVAPRRPQEGPGWPQDGPRGPQDVTERAKLKSAILCWWRPAAKLPRPCPEGGSLGALAVPQFAVTESCVRVR